MGRGEWVDPTLSRVSVRDWSDVWIAAHANLKPSTRSAHEWLLTKYILPRWATFPLVAVAHTDVQAWVTRLSETLAPSSVRKIHVVFSGLVKYALHDRRIPRNPCDGIRLPRVGASSRGYLTPQQVDELAASCGSDSDMIYLLAYTGLRWGEIAALKVKRVDLERRRLDVAEAVTEPEGEIIWGTPKNHERRSVPFPAFLKEAMTSRTEGKQPDDLVFPSPKGDVLRNENFRRRRFDATRILCRHRHMLATGRGEKNCGE